MSMNSQTRIIVATAAALAVVDIAVRLIPMGRTAPSMSSNGIVTAQQFRLVDQWGNERATLKLDANGEPGMCMYDRFGTERLQIDTWENTPSTILFDKNGQRVSYYGMNNETNASEVEMYGQNEQALTSINTEGNIGHVTLNGAYGAPNGAQSANSDDNTSSSVTLSTGN